MRVLLDANILISYLLNRRSQGTVGAIVTAGLLREYTLLVPNDLLEELTKRVASKKYLARRITSDELGALQSELREAAERIPTIEQPIPAVTRDRKDDYLLTYAVVGQADYLVSGDDDLVVLGKVEGVTIVRPAEFLDLLQQRRTP
jgi:uncharacterized protein